eukprot:Hpha_TRINITY_DN15848_c3_g1::TRINITY_DN15848_c3_g1_i1::g.188973::m.188973
MKRKGSVAKKAKRARKNATENKSDSKEEPAPVVLLDDADTENKSKEEPAPVVSVDVDREEETGGLQRGAAPVVSVDDDADEETGGLLLYADIHPACRGPGANPNGLTPVEVSPNGAVRNVISELKRAAAAIGEVRLKHQGGWLKPTTLLADAGVCQESAVGVEPLLLRGRRTLSCGSEYFVALNAGRAGVVGEDREWLPVQFDSPPMQISTSYRRKLLVCENGDFYHNDYGVTMNKIPANEFRSPVRQVSCGEGHSLILYASGEAIGLGSCCEGQCDIPKVASGPSWGMPPPPPDGGATHVAAGNEFSAAILRDGSVLMWGKGFPQSPDPGEDEDFNQGEGGTIYRFRKKAIDISAGDHALILFDDGTVKELGGNAGANTMLPLPGKAVQVSTAVDGCNMVLLEDGRVVAWGKRNMLSTRVPRMPRPAVEIHAGVDDFGMALLDDDSLMVWGKKRTSAPTGPQRGGRPAAAKQSGSQPERFKMVSGEWVPYNETPTVASP